MGDFANALATGFVISELLLIGAAVLSIAGVLLLVRKLNRAVGSVLGWLSGGRFSLGPASVQFRRPR